MIKKKWNKLTRLVLVHAGRSNDVLNSLQLLESFFAKWLLVEQVTKYVPNLVAEDQIKTIEIKLKDINDDYKRKKLHDQLEKWRESLQKEVTETAKAAGRRVEAEWKAAKINFLKSIKKKIKNTFKLNEIRDTLSALSVPLIGTKKKPELAKMFEWSDEFPHSKWPGSKPPAPGAFEEDPKEKKKIKEEGWKYIRFLDLLHTALKDIASTGFSPSVMGIISEKYGLPHEDVEWLSGVLSKSKTAPIVEIEEELPVSEDEVKHPSESVDLDTSRRAKVAWEAVLNHLPRAMHNYLEEYDVVYEYGAIFPPEEEDLPPAKRKKIERSYLGKEHRRHFFEMGKDEPAVDTRQALIFLPPTAAKWNTEHLIRELAKKSVDIFLLESSLLKKQNIEKYLNDYFIREKDIDQLTESLNALTEETTPEWSKKIHNLEDHLKKYFTEPEKIQKFHEWWAENQGHFTTTFKDKRMIPLFHRWLVETVVAMVTKHPIPQDIPFPILEFVRKMSSLDRINQHIACEIREVRLELMKEPGTEELLEELRETLVAVTG